MLFFLVMIAWGDDPPFPSDEFFSYLMKASNPDAHGMRIDRYYPYPSPMGFRIAFRQPVSSEVFFRDGWPVVEAEAAFRMQINTTVDGLRERLRSEEYDFDRLPLEAQELLVDFAVFDGVNSLTSEHITAIAALDWKRILEPEFYARRIADWPDSDRNKAFYERWKR